MGEDSRLKNKDIGSLIINILIAEGVGFIAWALNRNQKIYYLNLHRPVFAPPAWLFSVVWPILYLLMAIAVYLVFIKGKTVRVRTALIIYAFQLILNFLWPIIFFSLNLYGAAFLLMVALILLVLINTIQFFRIEKLAGFLMLFYLLWLTYSAVINFYIWILNEA